jgi:protein-disulfide isomerase
VNKKIGLIVVSLIIIIAGFVAGSHFYKSAEKERLGFLAQENAKLYYPDYAAVYGAEDAKVVVTEFLDPECESCRMFYPKVKQALQMYSGKVKLVVRYAAFHRNSVHAIQVLEATKKQGKYWEAMDLMFKYQPLWANHHNPQPKKVFEFLPEVGINIDQLKEDMKDPEIMNIIEQDAKDLKTLNVRGTPTFFVNGKPLEQFGIGFLYSAIDNAVKENYPNS